VVASFFDNLDILIEHAPPYASKVVMDILDGSPKLQSQPVCGMGHHCGGADQLCCRDPWIQCQSFTTSTKPYFHEFEFWSVMFFTTEYILRVWSLGAKFAPTECLALGKDGQYIFSPFGLVDFFATMPYYLHLFFPHAGFANFAGACACCALLKLSKYNTALQDLYSTRCIRSAKPLVRPSFLLTIAAIVSASLMHFAEGHAQS
jgi:hypothetical protein